LKKCLNSLSHISYILAWHLQIDAGPIPDPAYHFDADPDRAYDFDADADPDPTFQFGADPLADPDPQHCVKPQSL
jgi:hypothetical protein